MMSFKSRNLFRGGFTLMEVNLAIFIMAVGMLAMVALYPLAYRESQQSKDDVKGAAAADCILNTLTAALSSRNIKWEDWESGVENAVKATGDSQGAGGWMAYCDKSNENYSPKKKSQINSLAKNVYSALMGVNKDHSGGWPVDNELACALVAQWGRLPILVDRNTTVMEVDRSRVALCLRVTRRAGDLMSQPIYYTEIHFQGDQNPSDTDLQDKESE